MADTMREFVQLYLSGETTYSETLRSLDPLIGTQQARELLRRAVEDETDDYLSLLPAA